MLFFFGSTLCTPYPCRSFCSVFPVLQKIFNLANEFWKKFINLSFHRGQGWAISLTQAVKVSNSSSSSRINCRKRWQYWQNERLITVSFDWNNCNIVYKESSLIIRIYPKVWMHQKCFSVYSYIRKCPIFTLNLESVIFQLLPSSQTMCWEQDIEVENNCTTAKNSTVVLT